MTMNNAQTQIATAKLTVDLSTVSDDRLIELCLLYRANPEASSSFPADLESEIHRRFDASALANDDTLFSVLVNFSTKFKTPIPLFYKKLQEMGASVNRDIWFRNNEALFKDNIDDVEVMDWLVTQPSLLEKSLNNEFGLTWIAQSTNASTKILTHATAVDLWKNSTGLWQIWPQHNKGMSVLAQSSTLVTYVINNSTAMAEIVGSSVAMAEIAGSSVAMAEIASSSSAMAEIAGSSAAMTEIIKNTEAKSAFFANNQNFQDVKNLLYDMVLISWVKKGVLHKYTNPSNTPSLNTLASSVTGFVFATLGTGGQSGSAILKHSDGSEANRANTINRPSTVTSATVNVVSFNGATFEQSALNGYAAIEIWAPQ